MLQNTVHYCYFIMTGLKNLRFLLFIPLLAFSLSCSARIDGVVRDGGSSDLTVKTSLGPRTSALIRSIRGFLGETADAPELDGKAISQSMAASPGVKAVSLNNTGPSALDGSVSISNVGDFLAGAEDRFINYTEGRLPGSSSIVVTLDRDSAPDLVSRLSAEVEEYLSALMAPALLGENSTIQEYLDLLAMVYGRSLADEIAAARVLVQVEFPRPLTSLKGGAAAGKRAEFDIPLVDLLVLEKPLVYEAAW